MTLMRNVLITLLSSSLLVSCVTTQRYATIVQEKYNKIPLQEPLKSNITLHAKQLSTYNTLVKVTPVSTVVLPLVYYWGWRRTLTVDLDSRIGMAKFSQALNSGSHSARLNEALNGQRLELTVEAIPAEYTYTQKGDYAYVMYYTIRIKSNKITPVNTEMVVSYKLYRDTTLMRQGRLRMSNPGGAFISDSRSIKWTTLDYLTQYDDDLYSLSNQMVSKLADEIRQ